MLEMPREGGGQGCGRSSQGADYAVIQCAESLKDDVYYEYSRTSLVVVCHVWGTAQIDPVADARMPSASGFWILIRVAIMTLIIMLPNSLT